MEHHFSMTRIVQESANDTFHPHCGLFHQIQILLILDDISGIFQEPPNTVFQSCDRLNAYACKENLARQDTKSPSDIERALGRGSDFECS